MLAQIINVKGPGHFTIVHKDPVVIGSKFKGAREIKDSLTGEYHHVLPKMDGDAEKLQAALLEHKHLEWESGRHFRNSVRKDDYLRKKK